MNTSVNDSQPPSQGGSNATSIGERVDHTTGQHLLSANPDSHTSGNPDGLSLKQWSGWLAEELQDAEDKRRRAPDSLKLDLRSIMSEFALISILSDRINTILNRAKTETSNAISQEDLEQIEEIATLQKMECDGRQEILPGTICEVDTYAHEVERSLALIKELQSAKVNGRPSVAEMESFRSRYGRKGKAPSNFSVIMDK
ncbi:uncharacterized protein L203_102293 [Cryptococcus depauperatus CBS 7841]|uniref:Uncharacterized protein n=1 Tax=Cryptococcus depauperatus CBS 7841 TaxID=1295531 RepID=A0A1E3ICM9_9TREE|nr:hypothetical protein L203_04750 [Cryptococcus depauperatus CBS 7841]